MNISRTETDHGSTVIVSGAADLRDGAELKAALIECLDGRRETAVDLTGLEGADVAVLQLICCAVRAFRGAGVSLTLRDAGEFQHAWNGAGFGAFEPEAAA